MSPTILIVDDDVGVLFAMKQFFSWRGYHVDCTPHGMDARALLTATVYSVVIVDLHLSETRGAEGLEIIRYARARSKDTHILLVTADASQEVQSVSRQCGADALFSKPVSLGEISDTVTALLTART